MITNHTDKSFLVSLKKSPEHILFTLPKVIPHAFCRL